ncbi:CMRF35-like molecule 5 [Synchiropus splendidus]|uniref:CMRF35-like molecule 5 n=1 Tax=Synchiropus splendidus TaxID=270530 RepID=UPI00237EA238|nr:CMRF35-like molecule 5 [Synchiropus splendidus]
MEINSLMVLLCFLAGVSDVDTYHLRLTGKEGEDITITCSHSNSYSNTKFFCRKDCSLKGSLMTSEGPNTAKYRIIDRGNDFDVTIYNLEVNDSGLYWCGIDRVGPNTYTRVDLTVVEKPREEKKEPDEKKNSSATMKNETAAKRNRTTDDNSETVEVKNKTEEERSVTDTAIEITEPPPSSVTGLYVGAGLGICFGLVELVLLWFCLHRR